MESELATLDKYEHPNIVRVLDLFEDDDNIFLVFELMRHGTLDQNLIRIKETGASFTERDVANIVLQLVMAVNYLHNNNVVHRDLKLDNVMVAYEALDEHTTTMVCKVTDFGFAQALDPQQKFDLMLGTPVYMAPELFKKQPYAKKVDIWAIGVITHMLLAGIPPFNGRTKEKLKPQVCNGELNLNLFTKFYNGGKLVKDFIRRCLEKNPDRRPTTSELLEHPWLTKMQRKEIIDEEYILDVYLNLYTFKRSSLF